MTTTFLHSPEPTILPNGYETYANPPREPVSGSGSPCADCSLYSTIVKSMSYACCNKISSCETCTDRFRTFHEHHHQPDYFPLYPAGSHNANHRPYHGSHESIHPNERTNGFLNGNNNFNSSPNLVHPHQSNIQFPHQLPENAINYQRLQHYNNHYNNLQPGTERLNEGIAKLSTKDLSYSSNTCIETSTNGVYSDTNVQNYNMEYMREDVKDVNIVENVKQNLNGDLTTTTKRRSQKTRNGEVNIF